MILRGQDVQRQPVTFSLLSDTQPVNLIQQVQIGHRVGIALGMEADAAIFLPDYNANFFKLTGRLGLRQNVCLAMGDR